MLLCGAGCCLWTRRFSGRRARPWGLVLTCGLARCPDAQLWLPTANFACNSPTTISSSEFTALKSQRFKALLNLHPIELHATFEESQAPPPTGTAARAPRSQAFRSLRCRSQALRSLRCPPHRWRWGFCSTRGWLSACRRRVGSLMTPFPPFGGGEAAYVQVIGPTCAGCVHRNRRGTHGSQAPRRSPRLLGCDGGGTPKDPAPRYVR